MNGRILLVLGLAMALAGCQSDPAASPPKPQSAVIDDAVWDAQDPLVFSGCSGFTATLVADGQAVQARLPPGFDGESTLILEAAFCESVSVGSAEPSPQSLVVVYAGVDPHEGSGPEFVLLEASSSDPSMRERLRSVGIAGENVTVEGPRAPGGSWQVAGDDGVHYTVTISPNAIGRTQFDDAEYRVWGGTSALFAGRVAFDDRSNQDRFPVPCSVLVTGGILSGLGIVPSCTAQLSNGDSTTLHRDPLVTA